MKTRSLVLLASVLALVLAAPVSVAGAATPPAVTSVSPLKAKVGESLVVRGRGFVAGTRKNTVIFKSNYGPTTFVRVPRASRTSMTVPLPAALAKGMPGYPSNPRANRFQLRVVAGREQTRTFTSAAKSPVISPLATTPPPPSDVDKDGILDRDDPDNDNDFLDDSIEKSVTTDPRNKDTDGDGLEDGWEYYAAKDLNVKAVPYPGERPFPNALDPSDDDVDYDGDFLRMREEHALWKFTGRRFEAARASNGVEDSPLGYSDGTQTSRREQAPSAPAFQRTSGLYDSQWAEPSYPAFLARDGANADGAWSDDEHDADRDGLSNMTEEHGEMAKRVWDAWLNGAVCGKGGATQVKPWKQSDGAYYGSFDVRSFAEPTMTDPDVDGDGLLDAEDDQDNDDVPNYSEMDFECTDGLSRDPLIDADGDGEVDDANPDYKPNVNPYNPCAPNGGDRWLPATGFPMARTCPFYKPLDG